MNLMGKYLIRCLALGVALPVIFCCLSGLGRAQEPKHVGEVIALTGSVELKPRQETKFLAAKLKDRLFPKDQVRTGAKSKAKLWFVDETVLILGENTLLDVSEYRVDGTGRRLDAFLKLVAGKMRFIVHKFQELQKPNFQVEGTTAVLGVRGTDGVLEMSSPDKIYLLEAKKDLAVRNKTTGEVIFLAPMQFVTAQKGLPLQIRKITPQIYRGLVTEYQVGAAAPPKNLGTPPKAEAKGKGAELGNPSIVQDTLRNVLPFTHIDQPPLPTLHQRRPVPPRPPSPASPGTSP